MTAPNLLEASECHYLIASKLSLSLLNHLCCHDNLPAHY